MKKFYKVRLFRVMGKTDVESSNYDIMNVGLIIARKKGKGCRESLYEMDVPVINGELNSSRDCEYDYSMQLSLKEAECEYFTLREDFSLENIVTKKDMIKFDFDSYASFAMNIMQINRKLEEGVVYEKSIRSSKTKYAQRRLP